MVAWFSKGVSATEQGSGFKAKLSSLVPDSLIRRWKKDPVSSEVGLEQVPVVAPVDSVAHRRSAEALAAKHASLSAEPQGTPGLLKESVKSTPQDRLKELWQFPQADVSLAEVFQLFHEARGALLQPSLMKEVLAKTLAANLDDFPNSAQAVQDSFIALYEILGSAHSGLLSSSERKSLAEEAVQPMIDQYLARSSAGAEIAPDIYKAEAGFERVLREEELASLRALKGALIHPDVAVTLKGAVLLRRNDEDAVIPESIRTFMQLRQHLLTSLDDHIQGAEEFLSKKVTPKPEFVSHMGASGSAENAVNGPAGKPSVEMTIAGRSIKEHLTELIKLERDFLQKILLPKYKDLMTAIKASPNSTVLVQQLKSSLGSLPASVGRTLLSSLVNGMAGRSKPLAEVS